MAGWAGFSDEELRKLQQTGDQAVPVAAGRGRKAAPGSRSRQQLQRDRALQRAGIAAPTLPPEQQLSRPPPKDDPPPAAPAGAPAAQPQEVKAKEGSPAANPEPDIVEGLPPAVKELDKQEVELREKTRLELLQQEQKVIEERNKRKKALLTKTIAEKSRQTQAEAVKLKRIQKELQALDDMVSNDIGILRGRIEQASWDYSAARKRYEKAEAEYVTAKLDLHRKTEVKEQLTEHLCAIIQQNELRKAQKLEELMQQLQLQASEEELEKERRKEEEEEEQRRSCAENPGVGKEGNKAQENQEGAVQSTLEQGSTEEETVKQGPGGTVRQGCPPVTEPTKTDQDCKIHENGLPSAALASAS
ncbi:RAB6-interacting golgin [Myripristis murdjan]|uniref:RAB6-interacting golgin n=1 Tax=Myripristis murdjan TaxID=586833 RepID=A0A667YY80_9TELE|nr:RAB6-interacting golgin [Myripristis murdjan]